VQHPDPDDLALIALGESLGDAVDTHVAGCPQCSAEVESLRLTVGLADLSNYGEDAPRPGEHVWQAIAAELGFDAAERSSSGVATVSGAAGGNRPGQSAPPFTGTPLDDESPIDHGTSAGNGNSASYGNSPGEGTPLNHGSSARPAATDSRTSLDSGTSPGSGSPQNQSPATDEGAVIPPALRAVPGTGTPTPPDSARSAGSSTRRWPRWAAPVAAAVIGIAVGAGAVVITQNRADEVTVEAIAPLTPVPGGPLSGDQQLGQAEIVAAGNGQQVRVQAADLPATTNDYEVWLFGNDGKMVSLGTLNDGSGTFTVPQGISTQEYRVVDVSDEPPDGVPTHSGVSLVRGQFS